jgi:metal-sulfur cluster biosynthetic enzyme
MATLLVNEALVLAALKEVIDPELGINVVDLGLIYEAEVKGADVRITMTLTTPGCPLHESIAEAVQVTLQDMLPLLGDVTVHLVWDPPWTPDRISEEGRSALGWRE